MSNPATYLCQPVVFINGTLIDSILTLSVLNSRSFAADTFAITMAVQQDDPASLLFWYELESARVEIRSNDLSALFISGTVDYLSVDVVNGIINLEGRDLSSTLIETCPQQDYVNQTASDVVTSIALKHNLIPNVTPTLEIIGRYFGDDYTRLSLSKYSRLRSDWDLIVQLARECQFDAYVIGNNLYFGSPLTWSIPIGLGPQDISSLRMDRMLWIDPTPNVQVNSWNAQDMKAYGDNGTPSASEIPYIFNETNLTDIQVSATASRYGSEIRSLREKLTLQMPWQLQIMPTDTILLTGFNPFVDGLYRISQIEKHYNARTGSYQIITTST